MECPSSQSRKLPPVAPPLQPNSEDCAASQARYNLAARGSVIEAGKVPRRSPADVEGRSLQRCLNVPDKELARRAGLRTVGNSSRREAPPMTQAAGAGRHLGGFGSRL